QTIGAVQSGRGGFADDPKTGDRTAPRQIGRNTAHVVVDGGAHWNEIDCRVDSGVLTECIDRWKAGGKAIAERSTGVEKDTPPQRELVADGARNDVARSKLGAVETGHEALPPVVDENSSFAAHSLADKR